MNRTYRVRLGLVTVASLLALLVLIQPGHSQPGFPGGGIRGGVPVMPGPPTRPGPPTGIGGGFNGGIGQPPMLPQPQFPQPQMPGPQFPQPGSGIGGPTIYTWSCGRCGRVLGTGLVAPPTAFCAICGVNNIIPATPGGGMPAIAGQPSGPIIPPAAGPAFNTGLDPAQASGSSGQPNSSTTTFGLSRVTVIIVTLGVLLLLGVGIGGIVLAFMKNQPKKPRRRRRRRWDDDY